MKKVYKLLGLDWTSKAKAIKYIYRMLPLYDDGIRIKGHDALLLVAATDLHYDAEQKRGCGIDYFTVNYSGRHNTRCFRLHRIDGTSTDIAFQEIFDDHAKIRRATALKALRDTIEPQVAKLRKPGYHVHHEPAFEKLVNDWLAARGMTIDDVEVAPPEDNQTRVTLREAGQAYDWAAYHLKHAGYEVLTIAEHRARHKKEGKP